MSTLETLASTTLSSSLSTLASSTASSSASSSRPISTNTPTSSSPPSTTSSVCGNECPNDYRSPVEYYYVFIAVFFLFFVALIWLIHHRRRKRTVQRAVTRRSALARDMQNDQFDQLYPNNRRWIGIGRSGHGRSISGPRRREDGLDEQGEAPPPYQRAEDIPLRPVKPPDYNPAARNA